MTILDRIFETKRLEVEAARRRAPESQLRDLASGKSVKPFAKCLQDSPHQISLIAEVKKASPSQGLIRPDFDAVEIARAYERAGADCLSILTDRDYFQGDNDFLPAVKESVSLPCLRKDFVFDSYQVLEARALGADAVLLIASYLDRIQLSDLKAEIEALGMDALVEVHNEQECETAVELGCNLVGVNNRNLKDFEVKLANSVNLIPPLKSGLPEAVVVSESAIETQVDVQTVQSAGARSVLIGTTFCLAPDIESKVREVMGW